MFILLNKSKNIWLDPDILEIFESKPLVSDKSFFFSRTRFMSSGVFDKKEIDVFVDHRRSIKICGSK
jgi:hypothetical protein